MIFGQVEAEKIEVKDTRGLFHFPHKYVNPVFPVVIALLDFQNLNLTSCFTVCDIFYTNDPVFTEIFFKEIDF